MAFKQFTLRIIFRTILAMVTLVLLTVFITSPGYHAMTVLLTIVLAVQLVELTKFVAKTNAELVRFLDAMRYGDFSQRFDFTNLGTGFEELAQAFTDILSRLQRERNSQEQTLRHLKAIVEHVPAPLISINTEHKVTLWNNSARRLFGTHPIVNLNDLSCFGSHFPKQLIAMSAGDKKLIQLDIDGMEHQLSAKATEIKMPNTNELLFSLQDIQSELVSAQLEAWQDLVSVLTHEIMNSITPITSLANTASVLVEDIKPKVPNDNNLQEELIDISDAVTTVAKRSDSLMQFVTSYRRLTRLPSPNKTSIEISTFIEEVTKVACHHWPEKNIVLTIDISPSSLDINIDHDMLAQVLINLLKNAEHALTTSNNKQVTIKGFINQRGNPVIEVSDTGCGMNSDTAKNAFVPFYTTKRDGSGVGLALTKQVMLAHGGQVSLQTTPEKGSHFSLIF
ncbi:sensor histidine kinase [Litorilituus lipolyticus]|uniref:histidine kinase n=1 Tax=Litorilituus lipolyticus TaxID=2491017 RepID=A0A502KR96_9GAMM|nr:ATP-binding protein [Litorilituus lipolyticus]TPH12113.1 PAS domain-containing protein [Litorilituus lipolyticus]